MLLVGKTFRIMKQFVEYIRVGFCPAVCGKRLLIDLKKFMIGSHMKKKYIGKMSSYTKGVKTKWQETTISLDLKYLLNSVYFAITM